MTNTTKAWLHGLGAAFIGAAASSVGAMLVAPDRFNLTSLGGFRNVVLASLLAGMSNAALYLKASPLPPLTQTVEEKQTVSDGKITATASTTTTTTGPQ